jgi:GxxExxY protein
MKVYNQLGPGFLEAVYQEALEIEFFDRSIPFDPHPELPIFYKGKRLKKFYVGDFLAFGKVVVEIKAADQLTSADEAQLLNQLKVTCSELGPLINFGADNKLEWIRRVSTEKHRSNRDQYMGKLQEDL